MGDKTDRTKGKAKEAAGRATGNRDPGRKALDSGGGKLQVLERRDGGHCRRDRISCR